MTSINAMKFNDKQGILICDETRGWNPEAMKMQTSDKIKRVVEPHITAETRFIAFYGNTGTSSIGDELKFMIKKNVSEKYDKAKQVHLGELQDFMTIADLAHMTFNIQAGMKQEHIDETLLGRYGFTAKDFIAGAYTREGKKIDIKADELIDTISKDLIWEGRKGETTPIFLNAGIVAGYEPKEGFRIFHSDLITFTCQPVQEFFLADGSGRDMCTVVFTEYANKKTVPEKRGNIDPLEGIYIAIKAVNAAARHDLGVSGQFSIMYIDGNQKDTSKLLTELSDMRVKLLSELIEAHNFDVIAKDVAYEAIENVFFKHKSFQETYETAKQKIADFKQFSRFVRGYK